MCRGGRVLVGSRLHLAEDQRGDSHYREDKAVPNHDELDIRWEVSSIYDQAISQG